VVAERRRRVVELTRHELSSTMAGKCRARGGRRGRRPRDPAAGFDAADLRAWEPTEFVTAEAHQPDPTAGGLNTLLPPGRCPPRRHQRRRPRAGEPRPRGHGRVARGAIGGGAARPPRPTLPPVPPQPRDAGGIVVSDRHGGLVRVGAQGPAKADTCRIFDPLRRARPLRSARSSVPSKEERTRHA
jgi:hypothetical protein